ncbi:MAG: hypothetical protein M9916_05340 [Crocinitomicaceae bacterium]|nr:hypothetical protein [Crocinitomicaceae bacterium]
MNARFINYFISAFVIVICIVWIFFLMTSKEFLMNLSNLQRQSFIVLLLLYALFRSYRIYRMYQEDKKSKESEN